MGRAVAAYLLEQRVTEGHYRLIIPHVVDEIGRPAVFLAQLSDFLVQFAILDSPDLTVLRLQDVVLRIVDNLLARMCVDCCQRYGHHAAQTQQYFETCVCIPKIQSHYSISKPRSGLQRFPDNLMDRG